MCSQAANRDRDRREPLRCGRYAEKLGFCDLDGDIESTNDADAFASGSEA
jgi:hypothetical protein